MFILRMNEFKLFFGHTVKACPHRVKANAKAKKIKEQSEEIKEQTANIKENFRFRIRFCLV